MFDWIRNVQGNHIYWLIQWEHVMAHYKVESMK